MVPTLTIRTHCEKQNKTSSVASRNSWVKTLTGHRLREPILPEENISLVNLQYYICTRQLNLRCRHVLYCRHLRKYIDYFPVKKVRVANCYLRNSTTTHECWCKHFSEKKFQSLIYPSKSFSGPCPFSNKCKYSNSVHLGLVSTLIFL